nr:HD domain-containing protein [Parasporobacterium sp.]
MDINYKEKIMTIDIEKETADEHNKNVAKILEVLKQDLDEERFIHTLGVAFTASSLAMRYGENIFKANYAGLLHDSAKSIPNDKKAAICDELGIEVRDVERRNP